MILPLLFFVGVTDVQAQGGADYTSVQDGDWQTGSTWDQGGDDPGCTVKDDVVIEDTVTCYCDPLEIDGNGSITVKPGGHLIVASSAGLTGNGDLVVEDGASLSVDGDMNLSGSGDLQVDGDADVGGDLNVGGNGTADGDGDLTVGGSGCENWEGSGTCEDGTNLPVELISFKGYPEEGSVRLNWRTATELECDRYLIERATEEGDFEMIGEMEGAGTTQEMSEYEFEDQELPQGKERLYYRLVQVDRDGTEELYGPVGVNVDRSAEESLGVYPNPSQGEVFVEMAGFKKKDVLVVVRDMNGKEHYSKVVITNEGGNHVEAFDLRGKLDRGLYLITATSEDRIHQKKLMVE